MRDFNLKSNLFNSSVLKVFVVATMLILPSRFAYSSSSESTKVAIVDLQKIEENSLISKDLQRKMKNKEKDLQGQILKRRKEINDEFKALESKRAVLSGEELQRKAKSLESKYQEIQMNEKACEQAFEMARMMSLQNIQFSIRKAVNKVAGKYDMIIPVNIALYIDESKFDDLTTEVLAKLNEISKVVEFDKFYKEAKDQVSKMIEKQAKNSK